MIDPVRVRYRVIQFFETLSAPLRRVDVAYAARHLSAPLLTLFKSMSRAEQHHGIAVCKALEVQGAVTPALLTAALLHDVGKTVIRPRLWDRVLVVLAEFFSAGQAARWGRGDPRGWRRGFVVRSQHAVWGAALAERAGADPETVVLIRRHHDPPGDNAILARLQAIDDGWISGYD
ncbi:MAG: HDIG domain-containing protein [Anaerolineae bacterium]|nr:HDIG domain-containing protein [Anaerolineae bacterium]